MFMYELLNEVKEVEDEELSRATDDYGYFYNHHERYATILEEFEEATDNGKEFKKLFKEYWTSVKQNDVNDEQLDNLEELALKAAAEWIQVAVSCRRTDVN